MIKKALSRVILVVIVTLIAATQMSSKPHSLQQQEAQYRLNTSNPNKLREFRDLFSEHRLKLAVSEVDLDEVDSDPLTVIVHKASQVDEGVLVEDTSLDVAGADVGVNVRWLIDDLESYLGRRAAWTVLLAYRQDDQVYVFDGKVEGQIVAPRDDIAGFGFDPYFLPDGSTHTLAEEKPARFNARALAVRNFVDNQPYAIRTPIEQWDGEWQQHD